MTTDTRKLLRELHGWCIERRYPIPLNLTCEVEAYLAAPNLEAMPLEPDSVPCYEETSRVNEEWTEYAEELRAHCLALRERLKKAEKDAERYRAERRQSYAIKDLP